MRNVILGIVLVILSTAGLVMTIWRFALLQRYVPFLLRWGNAWVSFPATRIGFGACCTFGITIGCFSIDSKLGLLPKTVWGGALAVMLVLVIGASIHDFIFSRKRKV